MIDQNDPVYRAAFAPFQALIDANAEAMDQINQEAEEQAAALEAEQQEKWQELAAQQVERETAKAQAEKAEKTDEKPENPWAQPRRSEPGYGSRVGFLDEGDPPPVRNDAPSTAPTHAPVPSPPPTEAMPAGRHARSDDDFDDEFGGNSWLRG